MDKPHFRPDKPDGPPQNLEGASSRADDAFWAEALKRTEQGYAAFFPDGRFAACNPAFERLVGFPSDELEKNGRWIEVLTPRHWQDHTLDYLQLVMDSGQPLRFETELRHKDGRDLPVELAVHLQSDSRGQPAFLHVFVINISLRKKAEKVLRQANFEWELTFDAVPDLIAIIGTNHRILRVNQSMVRRLGLPMEEIVGRMCFELVHGTQSYPPFCPHTSLLGDGRPHQAEVFESRLGGHFLISASPMFDMEGRLVGSVHVARDISERVKSEEAIRNQAQFLETMLDTIPDPIFFKNPLGEYLGCNQAFEKLVNRPKKDILGRTVFEVVPVHLAEIFDQKDRELLFQGGSQVFETSMEAEDLPKREVAVHSAVYHDAKEKIAGNVGVIHDLTERKQAEALKEHVQSLIRHDLRTPLNAVINAPSIIRMEGALNPSQEELLEMIEDSGYRMLNMINLSLNLLKIERGVYQFQPSLQNLAALILKIIKETAKYAQTRKVAIKALIEGRPLTAQDVFLALGEELLCYSMMANLVKNALEASPEGRTVTILLKDPEHPYISIHNLGAVPESIRETFFHKYTTFGKPGGTGLGTYSAKLIAELHGGRIGMDSSEARGTTVFLRLPNPQAEEIDDTPMTMEDDR